MRHGPVVALLAATMLWHSSALSAQTIRVGENVRVAPLDAQHLTEPMIAADPTDPRRLIGVAIVADAIDSIWGPGQRCASFLSMDSGRTWKRHDFSATGCGDPWVSITTNGHVLFTALGKHPTTGHPTNFGLLTYHSPDAGQSWVEPPLGLGRRHDHGTMTVDATTGKRRGWIYITSLNSTTTEEGLRVSVFVVRSRDGGKTFDEPVKIVPNNLTNVAQMPAVLSDGTLIVSFLDLYRGERQRTWIMRSTDGGQHFTVPILATDRCPSWSSLAVDATVTSPFRDRLYVACSRSRSMQSQRRDTIGGSIIISRSENGGVTWRDHIVVAGAAPDTVPFRTLPTVAVNNKGVVGLSWLDARNDPSGKCLEMYFAASMDGGVTFLPAQRVSAAASCPHTLPPDKRVARWPNGGDYQGMTASADGRFHIFWSDARDRRFQLWAAVVEVSGTAKAEADTSRRPSTSPHYE